MSNDVAPIHIIRRASHNAASAQTALAFAPFKKDIEDRAVRQYLRLLSECTSPAERENIYRNLDRIPAWSNPDA